MTDVERAREAIHDAARDAAAIRIDLSESYLALIRVVEALPDNRSGSNKSVRARWSRVPTPTVLGPFDPHDR